MKKRKIVLIDGMPTSGKSTTSYNLSKKLPGWIFIDIWRIKDTFEPIGYSDKMNKEEAKQLAKTSKEIVIKMARDIIRNSQRNMILQEAPVDFIKKRLGKDLRKYNYDLFTVQLKVPFEEAVKRNEKRKKPNLEFFKNWTKEKWNRKIMKKIKKGDLVVDTFENSPQKVIKKILKNIGEKGKKHPYENLIRKFW